LNYKDNDSAVLVKINIAIRNGNKLNFLYIARLVISIMGQNMKNVEKNPIVTFLINNQW